MAILRILSEGTLVHTYPIFKLLDKIKEMELPDVYYSKSEYIETASGNKVSRNSILCGSQNIVLNGKTIIMAECIVRGDLANVRIGRHCVIR